jgi:heptosyltransferase-3
MPITSPIRLILPVLLFIGRFPSNLHSDGNVDPLPDTTDPSIITYGRQASLDLPSAARMNPRNGCAFSCNGPFAGPDRTPTNILVIQLGEIGDVVLATPTFRAVKETYPGSRLSVLVRKPCASLLEADPHLDDIVEVSKSSRKIAEIGRENFRLVRKLRGGAYDLVIDLRTGDRGTILAFLTGAPVRIARHDPGQPFWRRWLLTCLLPDPPHAPPPVHPGADQSLRLVRALGIDTKDSTPRLAVSGKASARIQELLRSVGFGAGERWITINPCSRRKYKEWVHERWAEVADGIWERHRIPAIFVGAPEESGTAEGIVRRCAGRAASLAGKTSLGELAALLAGSALHLGVDSAPPHIAYAVGAPTVTIFGPSNWKSWIVPDDTHRVVTANMSCIPCNRRGCHDTEKCRCLDELEAPTVLGQVEAVLRKI